MKKELSNLRAVKSDRHYSLFLFIAIVLCAALSYSHQVISAECRKTGTSCVEGPETRNISGNMIYQACWRYTSKYECKKPESIDYCAAISKISDCWQTSTSCIAAAWDGTCLTEQRTYRCGDPNTKTPDNTVKLEDSYTITKDELDTRQCASYSDNPLCYLASHVCVEGPETRMINGLPVYKECWKYKDDYSCINPNKQNDCQPLIDKGCSKIEESCIESTDPIGCVMKQITYSCITQKGTTTTVEDCSARTSCYEGVCWDTSHPNDTDFAKAVAAQEAAREAGVYGPGGGLFSGVSESCAKGYGGLKNCCKSSGGAQSNNSIMGTLATSTAWGAAQYGAKYTYDFMYDNSSWIQAGSEAFGLEHVAGADFSIGVYGLSYTFGGAAAVPATNFLGGPIYNLGNGFYFDPYSFAFAVAIQVVMELQSCEPEEQQLGMHLGANLCHFVGSYCSKKVFGACLETKQSYCCYNSKLSKIINEQGKPQIGKGWGSAESPNCGGFTVEEFQRVDFSKLDLSEFTADIMAASVLPNVEGLKKSVQTQMDGKKSN